MNDSLLTDRKESQELNSVTSAAEASKAFIVPYDENLLDWARTHWLFGDWGNLCKLSLETIQHHPERAKLALLAAAGNLQMGSIAEARQFICLAQDWGVSKKLLSLILISGVHNALGRSYLARGEDKRALNHFEDAVSLVQSRADQRLHGESRAVRQAVQMGLLPQATHLIDCQFQDAKKSSKNSQAKIQILESQIKLLHHELSLAQQRKQIFSLPEHMRGIVSFGSDEWMARLKSISVSQLGQDLWVLEKTKYKRGGFFVEFGATDGVLLSNTWLLEKEFGWNGICAEPNPIFFDQLIQNRSCIVSNKYIGRESNKNIEFILADVYGGSREFTDSDHHKDIRNAYADADNIMIVNSISLDDFLKINNAPREIDYLSIDTEGSEYDIISSFPFNEWNIRLITIEHNFSEQRKKIHNLLQQYGYHCTEKQWDDWFELQPSSR